MNIGEMSPQAHAALARKLKEVEEETRKVPFDRMDPGKSVTMPIEGTNLGSIRVTVSRRNSQQNGAEYYSVITHADLGLIEVARLI